ncbi:MAG: magnesium protoporphyrin IX methyltransferase [Gammaproteobacteria bacterium]
MPTTLSWHNRRRELETYFDETAAEAWARLTSDAPVSRIRETVRAGRDRMRRTLLDWLPADLDGVRLLDAGCGTGALAVAAAQRGAEVVAIDVAANLVATARERLPAELAGRVRFVVGDLAAHDLGRFDHAVAMDSLIHYRSADAVAALAALGAVVERSILFTFAPRTFLLTLMHAGGRLFPRGDRAPAIEPVAATALARALAAEPALGAWQPARSERIASGFYTSQALELVRR